jgi:hypothetical protein
MRDDGWQEVQERRAEGEGPEGRAGGLLDLLRRIVAPRQPAVLVMEPDGRLRRALRREGEAD